MEGFHMDTDIVEVGDHPVDYLAGLIDLIYVA
jgi:hypothetical protein